MEKQIIYVVTPEEHQLMKALFVLTADFTCEHCGASSLQKVAIRVKDMTDEALDILGRISIPSGDRPHSPAAIRKEARSIRQIITDPADLTPDNKKMIPCDIGTCKAMAKGIVGLNTHKYRTHGIQKSKKPNKKLKGTKKPFLCKCGKASTSAPGLESHCYRETGNKEGNKKHFLVQ